MMPVLKEAYASAIARVIPIPAQGKGSVFAWGITSRDWELHAGDTCRGSKKMR